MDYAWILYNFLISSCIANGIQHTSECDSLRRNVQRADSNSRILDPESHLTGQWLSQRCETRPGPIHLLRHYNFYPPHHLSHHAALKFKLRHYYYADTGCSRALYSLNIHGSYRVNGKSWAVPDASQMQYRFHKISIVGYNQEIVDELQHVVNESCSGHLFNSWSPHRQYTIFLSNLETDDLFSSRGHGESSKDPPLRNKQDRCLVNVYRMFQDLDLLKIVHRPMNAFDPFDRTKLYLGDLNTRVQERKSHVPTAFQVPLIKSTTIQGCDVCSSVLRSSYRDPPLVSKTESMPLYLDGEWISGECETQPLGIFVKRNLYVSLNNFTYESNIYSDSSCMSITMSVKYYGNFNVRALPDLASRTTEENVAGKKFGAEEKPSEEVPIKNRERPLRKHHQSSDFNVLPMIEMFANTQDLLNQNALMRKSRIRDHKGLGDSMYATVEDSEGSNNRDQVNKGENDYKVLSKIEADVWTKRLLDEQKNISENDSDLATNKLADTSVDSVDKFGTVEEKDADKEHKQETLIDMYEEILNSKPDGEFTKEIVDNLLTSKTRRHKRHNSKHGTRKHSKQAHDHERTPPPDPDLQNIERTIPTNVWSEVLPFAWDHRGTDSLLPNVKVNQMNTIDKKDLEHFFVRHITVQDPFRLSKEDNKVIEKLNGGKFKDTKEDDQEISSNQRSGLSEKHLNGEDITETIPINMPEKILYRYGRPNLGQVPIVEKVAGHTDRLVNPIIPLRTDYLNEEESASQSISVLNHYAIQQSPDVSEDMDLLNNHAVQQSADVSEDMDLLNNHAVQQSASVSEDMDLLNNHAVQQSTGVSEDMDLLNNQAVQQSADVSEDMDLLNNHAVKQSADVSEDKDLQKGGDSGDPEQYLMEFHIESADLKMYDYDLIENLKYDHNCDARFQLWGTIIGDSIPLRSSCLALGIKLPHLEHTLARLQVSQFNKPALYLEEPDQSRPLSEFQDPLANHNRIVNYQTLPLHKCKLYADDFYLVPQEEVGDNEKDVKDMDDEDEDEFDEPVEAGEKDYVESVSDKCDGTRSNVFVIICCTSVMVFQLRVMYL